MLTWEDDVEVRALHNRGWSISAIARHTGFDRKTVRKYLAGDGKPGERARPGPDPFDEFVDYVTARLTEDPHLWARTLYDELEPLGFTLSYQSLTRNIRTRGLRPDCPACRTATQRPNAIIEHSPGEEIQWDWVDLPNPPASWGWGKTAHLLVGSLAHSGRWRGWLSPSMDQGHLVAGLDAITRGLGGCPRVWRFDRMATVCDPGSGRVTASFAGVAKHYGVSVAICPPRRGNRKGVVEKANHSVAQRWWRTLADEHTLRRQPIDAAGDELFLEIVVAAEVSIDLRGNRASWCATAFRLHALPEELVVVALADVVEECAAHFVRSLDQIFEGVSRDAGIGEQFIALYHIGIVMLAVVEAECLRRHMGLECVGCIGESGKC